LAIRRRVQEGRSPRFPEDTAMTDSLCGSFFQNLPDATQREQFEELSDRNHFASSESHRLANPRRMNSGTIRRVMNGYLFFRVGDHLPSRPRRDTSSCRG
jgi:hypothetical protein